MRNQSFRGLRTDTMTNNETRKELRIKCEQAIRDCDQTLAFMDATVERKYKSQKYQYSKDEKKMETEMLWQSELQMFEIMKLVKETVEQQE